MVRMKNRVTIIDEEAVLLLDPLLAARILFAKDMADDRYDGRIAATLDSRNGARLVRKGQTLGKYASPARASRVLEEKGLEIEWWTCFTGRVATIGGEVREDGLAIDRTLDNGRIWYLRPRNAPSLFAPAYDGIESLAREFREALGRLIPGDFPIELNLCSVKGIDRG